MTPLQEAFLDALKSKPKFTASQYAAMYNEHRELAIEHETNNGASEHQAKAMGNYYTVTVLSDFIGNENKLARIIHLAENPPR